MSNTPTNNPKSDEQHNKQTGAGRPSQFHADDVSQLPSRVTCHVLGDTAKQLSRIKLAETVNECIIRNSKVSKRAQTSVAFALYIARALGTHKDLGFRCWDDYIKAMVVRHQSFKSGRHAERYIHAIQTWIVDLGHETTVLEKYGPSILGEIAQPGLARDPDTAKAWLRMLETHSPTEIRQAVTEQRSLLNAPEGPTTPAISWTPDEEDDGLPDPETAMIPPPGVMVTPPTPKPAPAAASTATFRKVNECANEGPSAQVVNMAPALSDNLRIEIVESKTSSGEIFFTTYIRRNEVVVQQYISNERPVVREMLEGEATELGREKRNVRVAEQLGHPFEEEDYTGS